MKPCATRRHVRAAHTATVARIFTVAEARALVPELRRRAGEFVMLRADLAELRAALRSGQPSALGGMPEAKGLEARLSEALAWFSQQDLQLKGWAPLLVDFPAVLGGEQVLLCWLEGDEELGWYHRADLGFAGRRPLTG